MIIEKLVEPTPPWCPYCGTNHRDPVVTMACKMMRANDELPEPS